MNNLYFVSISDKRSILRDWINDIDEDFLDQLLIDYCDYDYYEDQEGEEDND